ncbi:MAG: hypothetical protein Q9225_007401 [Loekoesia sp. 1 TL-2023]
MAILKDVEVRVVSKATGQPLEEYDKPGSPSSADGHAVGKYIEARTGEDFRVEVFIKKGFNCFAAWGIKVGITIDGGVVDYYKTVSRFQVKRRKISGNPIVFDSVSHSEGSLHSRIGFRFGSLTMNEDIDLAPHKLASQAATLGTIKVYVERVARKYTSRPRIRKPMYKPLTTLEAPKELLKDKHISNVMQPGEKTPGLSPALIHHSPTPDHSPPILEEQPITPTKSGQEPEVSRSVSATVKSEAEVTADNKGNRMKRELNTIDNHNNLAEEVQQLKQQLQESRAETAALMKTVLSRLGDAIQSAFATPTSLAPAAPASSQHPTVKRERIKEEDNIETFNQASRAGSRSVKRTKTVIELD